MNTYGNDPSNINASIPSAIQQQIMLGQLVQSKNQQNKPNMSKPGPEQTLFKNTPK